MVNRKKRTTKVSNDQQSSIDIDYVAKLANLPLSVEERALFEKHLKDVLTYISKLNEIDTDSIEPIGHITNLQNVLREDKPAPSLSQDDALKNAPKIYNGFFEVDAIFEEQ